MRNRPRRRAAGAHVPLSDVIIGAFFCLATVGRRRGGAEKRVVSESMMVRPGEGVTKRGPLFFV